VLAGGRVADVLVRRGRTDGRLRVGIIGAVGMLVSATAYPLMPSAGLAVAWLVLVNFFAAFPWGAASTAAAELFPAPLRAQGVAMYFFVMTLISATLGPTVVALVTDYVLRDEGAIKYSLAIVNVVGMSVGVAVLSFGLAAYRRAVQGLATR
jgi:MFS family permease